MHGSQKDFGASTVMGGAVESALPGSLVALPSSNTLLACLVLALGLLCLKVAWWAIRGAATDAPSTVSLHAKTKKSTYQGVALVFPKRLLLYTEFCVQKLLVPSRCAHVHHGIQECWKTAMTLKRWQ